MCDRSIHTLEGGEHNRITPEHMKMGGGVGGVGEEKKYGDHGMKQQNTRRNMLCNDVYEFCTSSTCKSGQTTRKEFKMNKHDRVQTK
jgi:hypothetical protein